MSYFNPEDFFPSYNADLDYQVNANSFYHALAKNQEFMKLFVKKINEFNAELIAEFGEYKGQFETFKNQTNDTITQFNTRLDGIKEEMKVFFNGWLEDGVLDEVINVTILNKKANITDLTALDDRLSGEMLDLETLVGEEVALLNEKTKHVFQASKLGIVPGGDISQFVGVLNGLEPNTKIIFDRNASYKITEGLKLTQSLDIDFNGATIEFERDTSNTGIAIQFKGETLANTTFSSECQKGSNWITVNSSSGFSVGSLAYIDSDEAFNTSRDYYKKGGTFLVTGVETGRLKLHRPIPYIIGVGATVRSIDPITPTIHNLNLVNTGTLERGTVGIQFNETLDATCTHSFSDKFNDCFQTIRSVQTVYDTIKSGRSWYYGTVESYGCSVYMSSGTHISNSVLASGRHGLSVSGTVPSYDTLIENSNFDNETDDGLAGLDFHENNFNASIIGGSTFGASLGGNISVFGMHFLRTANKGKNVGLGRYEEDDQSNYAFTNCFFSDDVTIRSGTGRQNPLGTNNRIGSVSVTSCFSTKLQIDLYPRPAEEGEFRCSLLHVTGTNNISLNVGGHVDLVVLENFVNQHNFPLFSTQTTGVNVVSLVIRNVRITGRTGSIGNVYRINRFNMDNVMFYGTNNTFHIRNGSGPKLVATLSNCDFDSLTKGIRIDDAETITLSGNVNGGIDPDSTAVLTRTVAYV